MPRLPTILVMGSHAISTSWPGSRFDCVGSGMIVVIRLLSSLVLLAGMRYQGSRCGMTGRAHRQNNPHLPGAGRSAFQLGAGVPPLRLLVDGAAGDVAQTADHPAVHARRRRA